MPNRFPIILVLLALGASCGLMPLAAQPASPPRGTEFWLAFLEQFPPTALRLDLVAGAAAADVRAAIPGSGWSAAVSIAPGGSASVLVPIALALSGGSERVENRGILVSATAPVTLSAISHSLGSADATTVLPLEGLGHEYVVATFDPLNAGGVWLSNLSELVVVAPDDALDLEITPAAATTGGRPAGVPFTITLQRGETYLVQSTGNLTGTRVRAGSGCDRFAVFSGNIWARVGDCDNADHLFEQMIPVGALGTRYAVAPLGGRAPGSIVEVIATADSTLVSIGGDPTPTRIDAGGRLRLLLDSAALIAASQPVAVVQFERGAHCDGRDSFDGDPSMLQLRPLRRFTEAAFLSPGALSFTRHFVTIVSAAADAAGVQLDGAPVTGFRAVPGTSSSVWAQLELPEGPHRVTGAALEAVTVYGRGPAISYGTDASATPNLTPSAADAAIRQRCTCGGLMLEAPEGFAEYRWSSGETTRAILARSSGTYAVTVGNGGDCSITSDSVAVTIEEPRRALSLTPGAVMVAPGEIIPYTIVLQRAAQTTCAPAVDRIALRFRATMLAPGALAGGSIVGDTLVGDDRVLTIRARRDTVLLDMVAALGDTTEASVILEAIGADSCLRPAGDTLSLVTFTGCDVGGRRLFLAGEAAAIKPVRPDPISGEAVVEVHLLEHGATRLELVDHLGRTVRTLFVGDAAPGDQTTTLDAADLPAGAYLLVLHTPSRTVSRPVTVH